MDAALRLADEVVGLTRDLIRLDTTNATGHFPGNETLVARHLAGGANHCGPIRRTMVNGHGSVVLKQNPALQVHSVGIRARMV